MDQDDSEDEDVRWYKEEVGEDPDEGMRKSGIFESLSKFI